MTARTDLLGPGRFRQLRRQSCAGGGALAPAPLLGFSPPGKVPVRSFFGTASDGAIPAASRAPSQPPAP
eukprot:15264983-Alexandrium_andersonii.AAC.1